jgi:hypothetical protein
MEVWISKPPAPIVAVVGSPLRLDVFAAATGANLDHLE